MQAYNLLSPVAVFGLLALFAVCAEGYRLNVPRALLPYHPQHQAQFLLEVTHPEGGCFQWRSSRPEIVSVEPVSPDPPYPSTDSGVNGLLSTMCSDKAIITSKSKHPEQQSAVIYAEEVALQGAVPHQLSCEATVDTLSKISIQTTTKVLFVDAAPARMIVEAMNEEGDRFSTLGAIPFDWQLKFDDGQRSLRILPFAQSKYNAPEPGIEALEREKKKGYVVLVEGLQTGGAHLTAQFADSYYSPSIHPAEMDLYVVTMIMLIPSEDLYLPPHAMVKYRAVLIRKEAQEAIPLPSSQYQLRIGDPTVISLNTATSTITALETLGRTELSLIDANVKPKAGVKPPQAYLEVVDPDSLQFAVDKGGVWYLQVGEEYKVEVKVSDAQGNGIYIPENALFSTLLPSDYFNVLFQSPNETHFRLAPTKTGKTTLKSTIHSLTDASGNVIKLKSPVSGEQEVEINAPVSLQPKFLLFPYHHKHVYKYAMQAAGGTGHYLHSSKNTVVGKIGESDGVVQTGGELGTSILTVRDLYNPLHADKAQLVVAEPMKAKFSASRVETRVGDDLTLYLTLLAKMDDGSTKPFTDCRQLSFKYLLNDEGIFEIAARDESNPMGKMDFEGRGCASVTLKALKGGDTQLKMELDGGRLSATVHISAYSELKLSTPTELLLTQGASIDIAFEGGPRAWTLDRQKHFSIVSIDNNQLVRAVNSENSPHFTFYCMREAGSTTATLTVGNHPSSENPQPADESIQLRICCSMPQELQLAVKHREPKGALPPCPAQSTAVHTKIPSVLELHGHGTCSDGSGGAGLRRFDSINSLLIDYSTTGKAGAKVVGIKPETPFALLSQLTPQGRKGTVEVKASVTGLKLLGASSSERVGKAPKLKTSLQLALVDFASAEPTSILLWAQAGMKRMVEIRDGSGQFWLAPIGSMGSEAPVAVKLALTPPSTTLELSPISEGRAQLSLHDLCIDGSRLDLDVKVADLASIALTGDSHLAVSEQSSVEIALLDDEGTPFTQPFIDAMGVELKPLSEGVVKLKRTNSSLRYEMRGVQVGSTQLVATANLAKGGAMGVVRSKPLPVQVFAPMKLGPASVTLLTESHFQLELLGGPQPTPTVQFHVSNPEIATISPNGLIKTGTRLGKTSIRAVVSIAGRAIAEDTISLTVASLAGIRVRPSSLQLEMGELLSTHIEGIFTDPALDGRPFSFGGALHPMEIEWRASPDDSLEPRHDTEMVSTPSSNRFTASWRAKKAGRVQITAVVKANPAAKSHFHTGKGKFQESIQIDVLENTMSLGGTIWHTPSLLMTPDTRLSLTNDASTHFKINPYSSSLLAIERNPTTGATELVSHASEGSGVMVAERKIDGSPMANRTAMIHVDVAPVKSIHLKLVLPATSSQLPSPLMPFLPQGMWVEVSMELRDWLGRAFHAANARPHYRPNRFDLVEIRPAGDNRTLQVHLKEPGETLLQVWDSKEPRLSGYLRLPVGDVLHPQGKRDFLIGEVACFGSPLVAMEKPDGESRVEWHVGGGGERQLEFVNPTNAWHGVALMRQAGEATIHASQEGVGTYAKIRISPLTELHLVNAPQFVSNLPSEEYFFPVHLGAKTQPTNLHNCESANLSHLTPAAQITPIFQCQLRLEGSGGSKAKAKEGSGASAPISVFSARPIFDPEHGGYGCLVKAQEAFSGPSQQLIEHYTDASLAVEAVYEHSARKLSSKPVKVPFYPRFELHTKEVLLNNVEDQKAMVSLTAVPRVAMEQLRVESCHPGILSIYGPSKAPTGGAGGKEASGNYQYTVQLNIDSAALWPSHAEKCQLTIRNTLTGQVETIPVRIRLYGDVAQAAINAMKYGGVLGAVHAFFEGYQTFALSTAVILICTTLFMVGYQSGFFYPVMGPAPGSSAALRGPQGGSFISMQSSKGSPQAIGPPSWLSSDRPLFQSTPTGTGDEKEDSGGARLSQAGKAFAPVAPQRRDGGGLSPPSTQGQSNPASLFGTLGLSPARGGNYWGSTSLGPGSPGRAGAGKIGGQLINRHYK